MRISQRNEYILLAVLVVVLATSTGASTLRNLLSTTVGRVVGLGLVIYVWKKVSAPASLLLLVMYIRYASNIEGMANKTKERFTQQCTCESGFKWNAELMTCMSEDPNNPVTKKPSSCTCEEGKMWDGSKGECVDKPKVESMPTPTPTNALAETTGPVTNNNTPTTPGEASALASQNANKQLTTTESFVPSMGGDLKNNYASF